MVSKYVAGREKAREFVRAAARHGLVDRSTLIERVEGTPIDPATRRRIREQIEADFSPAPK